MLRINNRGAFRPARNSYIPFLGLVPRPATAWSGRGTAFRTRGSQLGCTLLALWQEGCKHPWLVWTDLAPDVSDACWHGLRAWIEQGFKVTKSGGWQWPKTCMEDPKRAARLWLCVSIATLWLLPVDGEADLSLPPATFEHLDACLDTHSRKSRKATRLRAVRLFRVGLNRILVAFIAEIRQMPQPTGRLVPEPWPTKASTTTTYP